MKKLTIGGAAQGSKMLTRKAWAYIDMDWEGTGIPSIRTVSLKKKKGYEEVKLVYPEYVVGRQGEATYVHLPSFPDRLIFRALTARIEED